MQHPNRRQALAALSALSASALTGCGGGGEQEASVSSATESAAALGAAQGAAETSPAWTPQFQLWDAGSGPSRDMWSMHLNLPWKNPNIGDWIDAAGVRQGSVPFASFVAQGTARAYEVDITSLAAHWLPRANNRGAMLRGTGSYATWAGRLSATPPTLLLTTEEGTYTCPGLVCVFDPTTYRSPDTRYSAPHKPTAPLLVQFDLKAVRGTQVKQAVMRLTCQAGSGTAFNIGVYEIDAPRFQLGSTGANVRMGLAAGGEAALRSHPSVIRAGDFSNLTPGVLFDDVQSMPGNPYETLPDPDAPGTVMFRGSFTPAANLSFHGRVETMRADTSNPQRPPRTVTEELYCRLYVYLEDDWNSTLDANKMAIGWDLRMGWWNDAGYWQSTTGNGGRPGTGLKFLRSNSTTGYYEYQGHSVRMEAGKAPGDGNPYSHLRPLQSYVYNLDQPSVYGSIARLGNSVIAKGRWHCMEQRIKMNSVTGPFDALGNGVAVRDGELDTWLDGVLVSQVRGIGWRRHPEMGIEGPWINWYFGGILPSDIPMHYRMNHFVVAREYIGPRVG